MTKELQDLVWSILPKEFKEEMKKEWRSIDDASRLPHDAFLRGEYTTMAFLFGKHNLTSDAEGEDDEILHVSRKKLQYFYEKLRKVGESHAAFALQSLFGSKCLPDEACNVASSEHLKTKANSDFTPIPEKTFISKWDKTEPKPNEEDDPDLAQRLAFLNTLSNEHPKPKTTEPKFKYDVGDKLLWDKTLVEVYDIDETNGYYLIDAPTGKYGVKESDLEPYTEPKGATKMKPIKTKVRVYLATQEEDKEFRQLLHENGFQWNGGNLLIDSSCWESDIQESKIHFVHPDKTVTYCGEKASDTLTFSEFKKQYFGENVNLSQETANCDKHFDNILKDSFSKERRLNIAVQMIKAMMGCPEIIDRISSAENDSLLDDILHDALHLTDKLIAECEKGGDK